MKKHKRVVYIVNYIQEEEPPVEDFQGVFGTEKRAQKYIDKCLKDWTKDLKRDMPKQEIKEIIEEDKTNWHIEEETVK